MTRAEDLAASCLHLGYSTMSSESINLIKIELSKRKVYHQQQLYESVGKDNLQWQMMKIAHMCITGSAH